jgi:hypothetical protein
MLISGTWRQALGDQLGQYSTDGRIIDVGIDTADGAIQKLLHLFGGSDVRQPPTKRS